MSQSSSQPILIFSAGFGDGHNAAARSIQSCIKQMTGGAWTPPIIDLFAEGMPTVNAFLKWGYVFLTTHFPKGWKMLYDHANDADPSKIGFDWLGGLQNRMAGHLLRHRPRVIVSTYPLYPHILKQVLPSLPQPQYVTTVVTDSLHINSLWTNVPSDHFFVTDAGTRNLLLEMGISGERVDDVGFAVSPVFRDLVATSGSPDGLRLLFFGTSSARRVRDSLQSLVTAGVPIAQLTVVLGRHEKRLRSVVEQVLHDHGRCPHTVVGWTDQIPNLLANNDLVLTKAGGATTHECFALGVPMLVTHAIPGQEEGNARLLEERGCGWRCEVPEQLGPFVKNLWTSGEFKKGQQQMAHYRNPNGVWKITEHLLAAAQWPEPHPSI